MLPVFTCIFALSATYFVIFARRALVRNRSPMICLCNELFTGLEHDTTLDSLNALDREISLKNIQTYMALPEPAFHRLLDSGFAPSALSLCLNNPVQLARRLSFPLSGVS